MVKGDNPAGRLHKLLLEAKSKNHQMSLKQVWQEVFNLNALDVIGVYLHLVRLQESVNEIEKNIRQQDVDPDIYLQHIPNIRSFLAPSNLDQPIINSLSLVNEGVLMTLQFCSERLSKTSAENIPTEDQIKALMEEINELFNQIESSNIDKTLKRFLAELVESMRQALAEYRIRGGNGLREELFYIFERMQRTIPLLQQNKDEPAVVSFWDVLLKYDTLTSICVNAPAVLKGFQALLLTV